MVINRRRTGAALAAAALALGGLAACSSDGGTPSETSASPATSPASASPSATGPNETVVFDEMIQEQLRKVGCYQGSIDGIMGPQTDAAIVAFQRAEGLHVDGELGPQTDTALKAAAEGGVMVCTPTASPTNTASPSPTHGKASCTATAISSALGGARIISYVCTDVAAERWAAGQEQDGPGVVNFFLRADGTTWQQVPQDEVCGGASAGLPDSILRYCGLT